MGLDKYKTKRKFNQTPEPKGAKRKSSGTLHFVVQKHQASHLHYDFRLELDGVLKSWAVPKGPSLDPADKRLAIMVEDHPYEYKDFEGIIPEGNYGAGTVMIWDEGEYHALGAKDYNESVRLLSEGLRRGELKFFLKGKKLQGGFALIKLKKYKGRETDNSWLLIKENDEYAVKADITKNDTSARTGRTMEEIAEGDSQVWRSNRKKSPGRTQASANPGPDETVHSKDRLLRPALADSQIQTLLESAPKAKMPHNIKPMLAKLVDEPFDRDGWIFEVKWDGFRGIAEIGEQANLYSRNLLSFNETFPPILESLKEFKFEAVMDGEIVVLDEKGRSSFQLLQNFQNTGFGNFVYYVFDLLYFQGRNLQSLPLLKRKEVLEKVLPAAKNIRYSDHVPKEGIRFFQAAQKQKLEGIVAKNAESEYRSGVRGSDWLKIKTHLRQEAVIAGFTQPKGSRRKFGSLVLGVYEGDDLVYIGHTGSGFDEKTLEQVYNELEPLITDKSPFENPPKTNTPATWVKPKLVCEVSFTEWTADGRMRHPIFLGLRKDKNPREVIRESPKDMEKLFPKSKPEKKDEVILKIKGREIKLTNLDKIYWPKEKYTKGDLIDYYRKIAPVILPYLKDRPENLNRHPNGIEGDSFYQKNMEHQPPKWVKTKKIFSESNQESINYLVCNDEPTLIYMANLGCIEINPWNSRINNLDKPDWAVIDLDPEDIGFDKVVEAALTVHKILDKYNVPNYCKTSGATGMHIYIPLNAKYDYDLAKQFAQLIATLANSQLPKTTSLERSPKKRQKKVYLDYLQNRKGQTLAAPYSVRPKPGAPVSTPVEWKEVNRKLDPKQFTMKNIFKRLDKKGDLWKSVLGTGVDIEKLLVKFQTET